MVLLTQTWTNVQVWGHIFTTNLCLLNPKQVFLPLYLTTNESTYAAPAKSLQSCSTLCDLIDGSSPGSPTPGILQARTLEWVAISFSDAWEWKVKVKSLSHVQLVATPWTAAYQAPPSMGFSRQKYWSGLPLPSLNPLMSLCKPDGERGYLWCPPGKTASDFPRQQAEQLSDHYLHK